jgi:hypothetical protein
MPLQVKDNSTELRGGELGSQQPGSWFQCRCDEVEEGEELV